jgi:SsrA-binding protein
MSLLENKKAYFDYEILEKFEAGLELVGWEVKSLKNGRGSLIGAHVIIRGGEAFVVGLDVVPYQAKNMPTDAEEKRTIKVLLNKKEIKYLEGKTQQKGLTLVPIKLYNKASKIKMEIGLVKGKKAHDKRENIKKRETDRTLRRIIKEQ